MSVSGDVDSASQFEISREIAFAPAPCASTNAKFRLGCRDESADRNIFCCHFWLVSVTFFFVMSDVPATFFVVISNVLVTFFLVISDVPATFFVIVCNVPLTEPLCLSRSAWSLGINL